MDTATDHEHCAAIIEQSSAVLSDAIVSRQYQRNSTLEQRYGAAGRDKCLQDASYHLTYLAQSIQSNSYSLFNNYIDWALTLFRGLKLPDDELHENLLVMAEVLGEQLPPADAKIAGLFIEHAMSCFEATVATASFIQAEAPFAALARSYLDELLGGRRHDASKLILSAVENGTAISDIYLHVFQNTQREVGRLWHNSSISVGEEHYCTAATQMVMSQLYPYILNVERNGQCMVATCVGGELHEIGIRMVNDFFEMAGWDTYYLGANVPVASVIAAIKTHQAQVLGISTTISTHISRVRDLIQAVRADPELTGIKILVGGYPFNIEPELWRDVGADAFGIDAADSVIKTDELFHD